VILADAIVRSAKTGHPALSWWFFLLLTILPLVFVIIYLRKLGRTIDRATAGISQS